MTVLKNILVIDDDIKVLELIEVYLNKEGYMVTLASSGEEGLKKFSETNPDLIILDIMMPGIDGREVCKKIRSVSDVPIIMLSARSEEFDKVLGLELGADDYVTKPFSPREITARAKAILRRTGTDYQEENNEKLRYPGLLIDRGRRVVEVFGKRVELTPKEYELLSFLALNHGHVFSREALYEKVWGYDYEGGVRTVDVHITRLRAKLNESEGEQKYLWTIWGVGYKFEVRKDV